MKNSAFNYNRVRGSDGGGALALNGTVAPASTIFLLDTVVFIDNFGYEVAALSVVMADQNLTVIHSLLQDNKAYVSKCFIL